MNGWFKGVAATVIAALILAVLIGGFHTYGQVRENTSDVAEVKKKCDSMPERLARIEANMENTATNLGKLADAVDKLSEKLEEHDK